ncbi:helix-turn-helix domain-containing protein [Rhodococcus sp. (in: high G+C Gram-positive bacteria)]
MATAMGKSTSTVSRELRRVG